MSPPQDLFGALPVWAGVYALSVLALGSAALIAYRRMFRLILLGRPGRTDRPWLRLIGSIRPVLGQARVLQSISLSDRAGLAHLIIFWGFLSFLLSYILFIFADSIWRHSSEWLITETGVATFASYLDVLAALLIAVVLWAAARRWIKTPRRLSFDLTQRPDAAVILLMVFLLMVLTLLSGVMFAASGGGGPHSESLIGGAAGAALAEAGMSPGAAALLHEIFWWLHLAVILGFAIYIPLSKHAHTLGAPLSFFMRSLAPPGTLETPQLETADAFGAVRIQDFSRKQLLDGYACAVCGRCSEVCPATASGKILSPMHIVENLKEHVLDAGPSLAGGLDVQEDRPLVGRWIETEAVWDCLTCGACVSECPVGVEHVETIIDIRRHLVMEKAELPDPAREALTSLEQRGHPFRGTTATRSDWTEGLAVRKIADHPGAEYLLWVGCAPALEERSRLVARALARVLIRAGVDFAILGEEERCTGDPARRMGNEYLYQMLAGQNIAALERHSVRNVITICPHCFNTLRNEYPALGADLTVMHYTQLVSRLMESGAIVPAAGLLSGTEQLSYHDSCYLGRHNGIYEEPRRIARSIPGLQMTEMELNRRRSFCCGAGGGHMWMDESRGQRIDHLRADQFIATGSDAVVVSCPFCLQMFEQAIPSRPGGGGRRAVDLIELVDQALGESPPDVPGGP